MAENRVVVTGLGVVSPIGIGVDEFWDRLVSGQNGITRITHFDPTDFSTHIAAEVKDFDPEKWIEKKMAKRMDRFTHFAMAASEMALADAGLHSYGFDKNRAGVIIGSGIGGSQTIEDGYISLFAKGPNSIQPFFVLKVLINMAASMVSITYGLKGHISAPSVACSTGANAIGDAYRIIQRGDADIMVAGSSEACITSIPFAGFCATRSMTRQNDDPEHASKPFDKNRDGFVMGEGAGIIILENLEHAVNRKARIYSELVGYGNVADSYHFTAPHPEGDGMIRVMERAIKDAKINKEQIGYINAHGTSTVQNDLIESKAIEKVFGEHSKLLKISSNKSMIGHLLSAAASVECIATVMSVYKDKIPPTINYSEPDPDCSLDYVPNKAINFKIEAAASNSFGFGGGNVCLILKKYRG
ncbi:MAG: beta-ketoacyl-ACP synthase II [Spirochaetales bacterium]|nr:beta-ketoacyl-ACP synthase II [Spirochaetales bacterium]